MGIPLNQGRNAMPKQGINGAVALPIHGQSTGKGMSQGVPPEAFQFGWLDCWPKDPPVEVVAIQMTSRGLIGKNPGGIFPKGEVSKQRLGFFIHGGILYLARFRLRQRDKSLL